MIGTRIRFVATVVALTLLAAACTDNGVVVTSSIGDDGVAPAVAPPPDAIAPVLHRAGPPGDSLVGAPSSMGAFAIAAEPVYRLELWDGDRVLDIFEPNEPATQVATAWDWAPQTPGLHGLTLRAFDVEGGVATSFPVWVRVSEPKAPGLTGGAGPVFAGVGALDVVSEPLSSVSIDPEQCVATFDVAAAEGAQGIAVYAASFGAEGFVPAGLLPPRGGQVSLPVGSSPLLVYSEPFKPARSPGPPTLIDPPPTCAGDGVVGDPVLSDGVLANAKQADRAYLYMSIDDGETWSRVPGADQAFVYPSAGGDFDFTGLLPPVEPGQSASFEAWGWVDGDLTPLGRGSFAPPGDGDWGTELVYQPYAGPVVASSDLDWVVGTPDVLVRSGTICTYDPPPPPSSTTTTVPVSVSGETTSPSTSASPGLAIGIYPDNCANAPIGSYSKLFRWKPLIGGSEGGIVQVSTKPFPSGPILSFPGLIHVQSAGENAGGVFEFELPIDDIIDPPPAKSDVPDPAQLSYQDILSLGGGSGTAAAAGEKVTFVPRAVIGGSGMTLHVRVLPMIGGKPGLGGSNEVVIDVDDTPPRASSSCRRHRRASLFRSPWFRPSFPTPRLPVVSGSWRTPSARTTLRPARHRNGSCPTPSPLRYSASSPTPGMRGSRRPRLSSRTVPRFTRAWSPERSCAPTS